MQSTHTTYILHFASRSQFEIFSFFMIDLELKGKNVAVFGLGDQESYGDNYADASGEVCYAT